jgi:acetyl-CoA carboxylase biotin carboxylase subunit
MFNKILIANRGEIACRIIKTCKKLGISTVAIYSKADSNSLHVKLADESYLIGPPGPEKSYLDIEKIIDITERCKAEAVHPGYGFRAEDPDFVEECERHGIEFIGPSSSTMRLMGNKALARKTMMDANIRVLPGSVEPVNNSDEAIELAEKIGYPILVKAVYGGGGRGMRIAYDSKELERSLAIASEESKYAFGKPEVYLEKYLERPRHVEFQVLAGKHGKIIHLGERECSIQRRYQKLIEEAPSPALDEELRERMASVAIHAAKACKYTNAGTIEFLLDKDQRFYFLEMNKRIQVEHLITELVTGIDIVEEQIRIAAGEKLRFDQSDVRTKGWAINCRINCEDPYKDFLPHPGKIKKHRMPRASWLRIDTHVRRGYKIPEYYDSLIAKVAAWGRNRKDAIERLERALMEYKIEGIPTTIPFHLEVLRDTNFLEGNYDTNFISRREELREVAAISAALAFYLFPEVKAVIPQRRSKKRNRWVIFGRKESMKDYSTGWKWYRRS